MHTPHPYAAFCFLTSLLLGGAAAAAALSPASRGVTTRVVWQAQSGTWAENLAVRAGGELLVTLLNTPELIQVDPFGVRAPQLVHRFSSNLALTGITEVEPDVFAVVVGNFSSATEVNTPGSYGIWKVNFNSRKPVVSKVTDIPEAALLNGMASLDTCGNALVTDSFHGVVYRVDTRSEKYSLAIDDPLMKVAPNAPLPFGVNGLVVRDGFLYFTSTTLAIYARVPIRPDGSASGPAESIATVGLGDDLDMDAAGNAYITLETVNTLARVTPKGNVTIVAGDVNSPAIAGPTAVKFGRTKVDKTVAYVTSGGVFTNGSGVTTIIGGKVVAVSGIPQ